MRFVAALVAVSLLFFAPASIQAGTSESMVDYVQDRTVLVKRVCEKKSENGYGSGVKVTPTKVYTAYHLVANAKDCVFLINGKESKVLHYSRKRDIAALAYTSNVSQMNVRNPILGEKIICSGYSMQYFKTKPLLSITYGSITTLGLPKGLVRIDNNINAGHSGGGCFSEKDGSLLGLVVSGHKYKNLPITGYSYITTLL